MFASQDKSVKKKYQKPNILRKRSKKPVKLNILNESSASPDNKYLEIDSCQPECGNGNEIHIESVETLYSFTQSDLGTPTETEIAETSYDIIETNSSQIEPSEENGQNLDQDNIHKQIEHAQIEGNSHTLVNIESFFNESGREKYMLFDMNAEKPIDTLVVIDNAASANEMYIEHNQDVITSMVPLSEVASQPQEANQEAVISTSSYQNLYASFAPVKFKCDVPNCVKEFRSEQKFKRHKNTHEKDGSIKAPRQVTIECPVKKIEENGTETPCGKIFLVRELLLKHLNEEHTLDDAFYRCEECSRRFFWASGLRAHVRAHCRRAAAGAGAGAGAGASAGGAALACAWPGCGRVFRQPCRLREHARSHTGDRPYHCQYPECGWSFRSASKLVRHARRHTGERKHACAACGRGFLRREHLREHHARHHAPHARRPRPCPHPGCELTFNNMSTLYLHMKRVHKKQEDAATAATVTETLYTVPDNLFMVSLTEPDAEAASTVSPASESPAPGAEAEPDAEDEWHSARTHCTWPLERAAHAPADDLLKHSAQVEQSEGSESNTYTVRSDLFLHGNVLINEDSEHMGASTGDALGGDLGLLDAHPTIDLMQEELMYADTAADESSFRIFLLSGEELT